MLSQIAYVRQQVHYAQRAGTPSARADHLQRALDGLARLECQARDALLLVDLLPEVDPFLPVAPVDAGAVFVGPDGVSWTVEDILAREG